MFLICSWGYIRLLKARLKVLLKVLVRFLKARLRVLLKVLIRLLKARLKVLVKVRIRLLKDSVLYRGELLFAALAMSAEHKGLLADRRISNFQLLTEGALKRL